MMKRVAAVAAAGGLAFALTAPAALGQGASDNAPGKNKVLLIGLYGQGGAMETGSPTPGGHITNLGGAISGGFYGNTSNSGSNAADAPDRGTGVNPSSSPGPVVGGCTPGPGASVGYAITGNGPVAVPKGNIPDRC